VSAAAPSTAAATTPAVRLPGSCGVTETATQALGKLNDYRAVGARCGGAGHFPGTVPLQWQPALAQIALTRSRRLAEAGPAGLPAGSEALTARLTDSGYAVQAAAENRAAGPNRLAVLLAEWVRTPTACAQMLSPAYTDAGLACERAADGTPHWVLVLAKPR
jgi:uncharacterized protein YkwD